MLLFWPSLNQRENVNQAVLMDLLFCPRQCVKRHVFLCMLGGRVRYKGTIHGPLSSGASDLRYGKVASLVSDLMLSK